MRITLFYATKSDLQSCALESEASFNSFKEFCDWFYGNVEFSADLDIYDGHPCALQICCGNYVFEKAFDSDITWDELRAMLFEMEQFFIN